MISLLLVDDEAIILQALSDALEDGGYSIVQAVNGDEAMTALRAPNTPFAGLVTDIRIGDDVTGWDVARTARAASPDIPVVYMTGDSAHEWTAQGVPHSLIVQKPFAFAQILTAMSQLINEATTRRVALDALISGRPG